MTAELSEDARAIAGGLFGSPIPVGESARFERPQDITARAAEALVELVEAGILEKTVTSHAVCYRPLVDCSEHYDWLRANMHRGVGRFPIMVGGRP